ncbi:MAG: bifunctional riboflavin kinase/FAD synthetase [Pseudomonadales bacterium]|jgi:riboflavin kinase/FMN adenylyltransferase|nr:bifunctional riboflavin kinase/FAD synthetase [Pseudomonadales bacterium]
MEVIRGMYNLRARHRGCVATIGNFDGVHRGHRALLEALHARAGQHGLPTVVITFEPQPREYFRGRAVPARLTRLREKLVLLERAAVDRVLLLPFNDRLAALAADAVVRELLVERLGVRHLLVGDDFRFGRGREGDVHLLRAAGAEHGFEVGHLDTQLAGDERISSTRIRDALAAGDLALAEHLLGHRYFIMGRVVYGRQLGRELGTPTVNIPLKRYRAALEGVFAVEVEGLGGVRPGIANIGVRPTVDGREPLLEVHLLDWSGDAYGELLTVTFRERIRAEQRFDSIDALREQIARDVRQARAFFGAAAAQEPA